MRAEQVWAGVCYDCGTKVVAGPTTSHDGEACPMCTMLGRSGTIRADRPVVKVPKPLRPVTMNAPADEPAEVRSTPQRVYPCLDCGNTYSTPDHACPAEGLRR